MHLTAGNSIPGEENGKNISNSKHDNNEIVLLRSVMGKPLQKNEPYSLTHVMFGAQLCKLCVHSSTSVKN